MSDSKTNDSTNAAAGPEATASRGVFTPLLQRNPLVALGAALLGPIIGLFKPRRRDSTEIQRLKHTRPAGVGASPQFTEARATGPIPQRYRTDTEAVPSGRRRRSPASRSALKGGLHHG